MSRGSHGVVRRTDLRRRRLSCYECGLDLYGLITDCPPLPESAPEPVEISRLPSSLVPHDDSERSTHRLARLVAIVAGIVGALLCALVPLLPVTQTTATILWPQGGVNADGHITDITAPLVSGAPRALDISIPCGAIATLPADGGLVVSTLPVNGFETGKSGLFVRANKDTVVVAFRDSVAAAAPRSAVAAGTCSTLHIWADAGGAGADFVGIPGATGKLAPEKKPAVGGIFTDLAVAAQPGLSARIDVDTRFIVAPTMLKRAVLALGGLAVLASIVALGVLDRQSGHRTPRNWRHLFGRQVSPRGWPTPGWSPRCCSGMSSALRRRTTATT